MVGGRTDDDAVRATDLGAQPLGHLDAVGVVATGYGWQGVVATLATLRQIAHALRGHPTPLGAGINSLECKFADDGTASDDKAAFQLATVGQEVVALAADLQARPVP